MLSRAMSWPSAFSGVVFLATYGFAVQLKETKLIPMFAQQHGVDLSIALASQNPFGVGTHLFNSMNIENGQVLTFSRGSQLAGG